FVVKEIPIHEPEDARREIVVVARPSANYIGGGGRSRALLVVGRVNRIGIQDQLVLESLARRREGDIEILAGAIAASQSESQVQPAVPPFSPSRMQALLMRRLFSRTAQCLDRRPRRLHRS